jgi:sodium/potassium-transporting ATPase subunit alpha
MQIHRLSADEAISSLRSRPQGLLSSEAEERLQEYGYNRVKKAVRESLILRLLREFTRFFSLILWMAAGLAFLANWSAPGEGMARLGYAIIGVILVSGFFSFWQEYRVEQTLAALNKLLPQRVDVLREGIAVLLDVDLLVPGDIVLLEQGNRIPADCRLIEAFDVRVNNGAVTGESLPKKRSTAPSEENDLIDGNNIAFAGTSIVSGRARGVIFATGMNTELGKIAHLTQSERETVSPLRNEIAHLSRMIAAFALLIGLAFFSIGWLIRIPFWQNFIFSIGIIVAMVPEGLLPTLTLALVLATQRMAKRNVLIRFLPSVETMGSTTVICTDKTGTLTQNRMEVKELFLGEEVVLLGRADPCLEFALLYRHFFLVAHLCNNLKEGEQGGRKLFFGDPMEIALFEMAQKIFPSSPDFKRIDEVPFDADRMRMSVVYETPEEGPLLLCKGAPESIISICDTILIEGEVRPFSPNLRQNVHKAHEVMSEKGLRVIAHASISLNRPWQRERIEQHLTFCGLSGLEDPPRPEVPKAIQKCREAGIRVIMITGDHPHTALAIGKEIGLVQTNHPLVVTGAKLRGFSDTQLRLALDSPEIIFARVGADQKMRIVEALKEKGHIVAVTGDGVNDAPALKSAHIGIAMGLTGTDVAKESADMILLDDNFVTIVNAIEEGRAVFENIRKFLTYILAHNVPELIPYFGFALFQIPLPLTPIQILSIDMGTDSLTALGLGVEKPDPEFMQVPPRSRNERLLNWPLVLRAYFFTGLIESAAAMSAFFFVLYQGNWMYGQNISITDPLYLQATTACLTAIVLMQIINVFLCRSQTRSVLTFNLLSNRLIVWGVGLEIALILLIDYTPWGNAIFGTAPIKGAVWLFVIPFALGLAVLDELRKRFIQKMILNRKRGFST